jgi:hypothetical protein
MKHLALAVALALCAVPALADDRAPFEQTQLDRALPSVPTTTVGYETIANDRMPFEQSQLDRALVDMPGISTSERVQLAQLGGMSYKSGGDSTEGESPWANDHNFIAPAQ